MKIKPILFLSFLLLTLTLGCIETGQGSSADTIQSIEYSGLFCKTWKVWLTNDHPYSGYSESSDAIYSVRASDTALLKQLQELSESKERVRIYYKTSLLEDGCFTGLHSGYAIIYKVEEI